MHIFYTHSKMDMANLITAVCNVQFIKEAIQSDEYLGRKKPDHFDVDRYDLFLDALIDEKRIIEHKEWYERKRPPIYDRLSTHLVAGKIRYLFKCLVIEKHFKDGKRLVDLEVVPYIGECTDGTNIVAPMTVIFNDAIQKDGDIHYFYID